MDKSSRELDLNGPALPAPGGLDIGLTPLVVLHVPPTLLQFGLLKGGVGVQAVTHPLLERLVEGAFLMQHELAGQDGLGGVALASGARFPLEGGEVINVAADVDEGREGFGQVALRDLDVRAEEA